MGLGNFDQHVFLALDDERGRHRFGPAAQRRRESTVVFDDCRDLSWIERTCRERKIRAEGKSQKCYPMRIDGGLPILAEFLDSGMDLGEPDRKILSYP